MLRAFCRRLIQGVRNDADAGPGCLVGCFDVSGGMIFGWVENILDPSDGSVTIDLVAGDNLIASTAGTRKDGIRWHFEFSIETQIDDRDILYERVQVIARDSRGRFQALRLEGSTQLDLIREIVSDPVSPFLQIEFRDGGNSDAFLIDGWSVQEKFHRWTLGQKSLLGFVSPHCDCDHLMELLIWPHAVAERHPQQRLYISVDDEEIAHFSVTQQSLLKFVIPASLIRPKQRIMVCFTQPDAISPARVGIGNDPRPLAIAFKRIKIKLENVLSTGTDDVDRRRASRNHEPSPSSGLLTN